MKIAHVPYCYAPDPEGGTETYVRSLIGELGGLGFQNEVIAPGVEDKTYVASGVTVRRYAASSRPRELEELYGEGFPETEESFARALAYSKPEVVHFHAYSPAVGLPALRAAKSARAKLVFTYHTPAVSCQRGTLMRWGRSVCDGKIRPWLCAACHLQSHGMPESAARIVGAVPAGLSRAIGRYARGTPAATAVRARELLETRRRTFNGFLCEIDKVIVLSDWCSDVLQRNGVEPSKILRSPHGASSDMLHHAVPERAPRRETRIVYAGRLSPEKGVHLLIEGFRREPRLVAALEIYGVRQDASPYLSQLKEISAADARINFHIGTTRDEVLRAIASADLVAVPSLCLETGPLTVLESFSFGIPVVGSDLGGIREKVRHGVDGWLVRPDVADWQKGLRRLCEDRLLLERLREGVEAPRRTMHEVAGEMAVLYEKLTAVP